jgi:UDP-N-acetylmuramyl pentapeptide phosphotransferase/UDP-N-acetylglucosamine-1-phosphate transferase
LGIDVLTAFAISMLTAFLVLSALLMPAFMGKVVDLPNERSLHTLPVPRTGGLGLMAGVLAGWVWAWQFWLWPLLLCVLFLMLVSFLDDLYGLSAGWRFLMHFGAAAAFVGLALPDINWLLAIVFVIAMVWMTNLYNFMDGSDGLAGGMALFGFGFYVLAAWLSADMELAGAALMVVGGAAAFLVFNFHPAKIFMGDAGSIPLGFLAAALGVLGWQRGHWPLWFPVLVFSPFIVDATVTLVKRLLRGEKVWQAHRNHYYQRLVQMGWGHRKTALIEYSLMIATGASATVMLGKSLSFQLSGLGLWLVLYAVLTIQISRMWRRAASQ